MTLHESLRQNRGIGPGFHLLRHLLAFLILAHHCRVAVFGVFSDDTYAKGAALTVQAASHLSWGHFAVELARPWLFCLVAMFFGLSGFLVVGSALRNSSAKVFFANRALRILPALTVEVTLSALVLGPLFTSLSLWEYFSDPLLFRYFGNVVGHVAFRLPGVFLANPWPDMVNANLWTLPPEFWCYLIMLVMMASGVVSRRAALTAGTIAVLALWQFLELYDDALFSIREGSTHFTTPYIVMMFFLGVLFFINADRIPLSPLLFGLSLAAYYLLTLLDRLGPLSGVFLTYAMVYIGTLRFAWFDRMLRLDLSYGTYLYGFPITQATIQLLLPHLPASPFVRYAIVLPVVTGLTVLFSTVSWTCVEKPALGLRRRIVREPAPTAAR